MDCKSWVNSWIIEEEITEWPSLYGCSRFDCLTSFQINSKFMVTHLHTCIRLFNRPETSSNQFIAGMVHLEKNCIGGSVPGPAGIWVRSHQGYKIVTEHFGQSSIDATPVSVQVPRCKVQIQHFVWVDSIFQRILQELENLVSKFNRIQWLTIMIA